MQAWKRHNLSRASGIAIVLVVAISLGAYQINRGRTTRASEPTLADVVAAAQSAAADDQTEALADGTISWEEHELAIGKVADCLSARGVAVLVEPSVGKRPSSVGFSAATLEDGEAARAWLVDCQERFISRIEKVWLLQNMPTAADLQRGTEYVRNCLVRAGVPVSPQSGPVATEEIGTWLANRDESFREALHWCMVAKRAELGF